MKDSLEFNNQRLLPPFGRLLIKDPNTLRLLLLHQNFPGQYAHIGRWARANKNIDVRAITDTNNKRPEIVDTIRYPAPSPQPNGLAGSVRRFSEAIARGEATAKAAIQMRAKGFVPDLVLGHGAWGETFYLKEVFPKAKLVTYAEFYYNSTGYNIGFDQEFDALAPDAIRTVSSQNAVMQMSLHTADFGHAPTRFQAQSFPVELQSKIGILFDGINTNEIKPNPNASITLSNGLELRAGDPVVTFINRNFEPYRGYHIFMRALPKILADNPKAHVIMIGGDGVSYGAPPPAGKTWRDIFFDENKDRFDTSRVHFPGRVSHDVLRRCYEVSAAHVYLTYPFVLSWSMMEAMAAGCLVIGSDVAPVREVLTHEENGLLVPFFDPDAIAASVSRALQYPNDFLNLRRAARDKIVSQYDLATVCLPAQLRMYENILNHNSLGEFGRSL
jgi:glycosyltransferase involved in cell wall biosynthesis